MNYAEVDPIISAWVQRHGLTLYTQYQDSEVRSVDIVDSKGRKFQIWIDSPTTREVAVHAWDYRKRRKDWNTTTDDLGNRLEDAFGTVTNWIGN